jgi:hypothetical protein
MIKDSKGRKWLMRFKLYQQGWHWRAEWKGHGLGMEAGECFATKALAEADAQRFISTRDHVAMMYESGRRLQLRGTFCAFTADDYAAIAEAGRLKSRAARKAAAGRHPPAISR